MNGKHYISGRMSRFETWGQTRPASGIALAVDDGNEYKAGDQSGNVLEIECPYGSQAMADGLLAKLAGRSYMGYVAENAVMDPAAELGDGITANGIYSLLAAKRVAFGSGHVGEVSAPVESDLDHEYHCQAQERRETDRRLAATRSYIEKTAEEVRIGVESEMEGLSAQIDVKLEGVTSRVTGLEGSYSAMEQTVGGITSTVEGLNGAVSRLEQTAEGLESGITGVSGQVSALKQTAESLESRVQGAEGSVSALEQRMDSIKLSVSGSLGGSASIVLSVDGETKSTGSLSLGNVRSAFASDRTAVTITGGTVTFNSNTFVVNSSNFSVTASGSITATAGTIAGWSITSTALYKGTSDMTSTTPGTYIGTDGIRQYGAANRSITMENGALNANGATLGYVTLTGGAIAGLNAAAVSQGNIYMLTDTTTASCTIYGVAPGGDNTALVYASTQYNGGKASAVLGYDCPVRINGNPISMERSPTYGSDRDVKKDIVPLPERYLGLLDEMEPVAYRYRDEGADAPVHLGYIAQDVVAALERAGMSRADLAAVAGEDGTGQMGISYTDFIPVLHLKLRRAEERIKRLEEKTA